LTARATLYTVTTRRLVMRFGVALPMSINLPFNVRVGLHADAPRRHERHRRWCTMRGSRVGYLVTWPHVRPWQIRPTAADAAHDSRR
jgi:hypothetical protein